MIGAVQAFLTCTYHAPEVVAPRWSVTPRRRGSRSVPIRLDRSRADRTARPPSSSGLGHHPLKVATRVRIPLGLQVAYSP